MASSSGGPHGPMTLGSGSHFGGGDGRRFRVEAEVGQGGQGTVFKAFDTRLHRAVALKVSTATEFSEHQKIRERFERELRLSSRANHPHVLQVYDCGELDSGHPYVLLEWMERGSLAGILKLAVDRSARLPARYIEYYARSLAVALRAVHAANMIHRDVKPDNVLISKDGVAKLTDFGIAKDDRPEAAGLTMAGMVFGTPGFMAPEQWRGASIPTSDVFAFGATLYVLITGVLPPQKKSGGYPLGDVLDEAWGTLPEEAVPLLRTLLSPDLGSRPGSFDEVLPLLDGLKRLGDRGNILPASVLPPLPAAVFNSGVTTALPATSTVDVISSPAPTGAMTRGRPSPDDAFGATADLPAMDTAALTGPQSSREPTGAGPGATGPASASSAAPTPTQTAPEVEALLAGRRTAAEAPGIEEPGPTRAAPAKPAPPAAAPPVAAAPQPAAPAPARVAQAPDAEVADPADRGPAVSAGSSLRGPVIGLAVALALGVGIWWFLRSPSPEPITPMKGDPTAAGSPDTIWSLAARGAWPEAVAAPVPGPLGTAQAELLAGRPDQALAALAGVDRTGIDGAHAARIEGAAHRLAGAGDYAAAARSARDGHLRALGCAEPECATARAALEHLWDESCVVAGSTEPACAGRPALPDPRTSAVAAAWIRQRDGHGAEAAGALQAALSMPGAPSCAESDLLRAFAAGPVEAALRPLVAESIRRAARSPAECASAGASP